MYDKRCPSRVSELGQPSLFHREALRGAITAPPLKKCDFYFFSLIVSHEEGGWPKDLKPDEKESVLR